MRAQGIALLFGKYFLMGQNSWKALKSPHSSGSCIREGTNHQ